MTQDKSSQQLSQVVASKFLLFSFRDIGYDYDGLTKDEQGHCSQSEFYELVAGAFNSVQINEPDWFARVDINDELIRQLRTIARNVAES